MTWSLIWPGFRQCAVDRRIQNLSATARVLTTQHIVEALAAAPNRQTKLLQHLAIGYFGDRGRRAY